MSVRPKFGCFAGFLWW